MEEQYLIEINPSIHLISTGKRDSWSKSKDGKFIPSYTYRLGFILGNPELELEDDDHIIGIIMTNKTAHNEFLKKLLSKMPRKSDPDLYGFLKKLGTVMKSYGRSQSMMRIYRDVSKIIENVPAKIIKHKDVKGELQLVSRHFNQKMEFEYDSTDVDSWGVERGEIVTVDLNINKDGELEITDLNPVPDPKLVNEKMYIRKRTTRR